jgi:predicted RNase H-like HicB family nuclease
MADISMNFNDTPINIQLGEHGLYYGTSPHIKGLLVTGDSVEQVMGRVPGAIAEMRVAAEMAKLKAELEEAKDLLRPFASFTGKDNYDDDKIDIIGEKGSCGNYCVPDSHGFEVIWADEDDGKTVHFTAGQFRRVRAFLNEKADGGILIGQSLHHLNEKGELGDG